MVFPTALMLYGMWIGSTLAVYHGGPVWVAVTGSVACFFLIPLAWELLADQDQVGGRISAALAVLIGRSPKGDTSQRFQTLWPRGRRMPTSWPCCV